MVNMSIEEMLEYIYEALEDAKKDAEEYKIEQVYEFLLAVEY